MKVSLVWITPNAEGHMAYCARASSEHQDNPDNEKLLRYCVEHGHWSVFTMANLCMEFVTSRAISRQVLRHKFEFQEFSQRYAAVTQFEHVSARRQAKKNRQSSVDDLSEADVQWFNDTQAKVQTLVLNSYREALERGIAKESARFLLPEMAQTKLYINGTVRNWIHYIQLRVQPDTQFEHREIALACKNIFASQLPTTHKALAGYKMLPKQEVGW